MSKLQACYRCGGRTHVYISHGNGKGEFPHRAVSCSSCNMTVDYLGGVRGREAVAINEYNRIHNPFRVVQ